MERRFTPHKTTVDVRADGAKQVSGYAAVFYRAADSGTEYQLYEDLVERIMPGAFDQALKERHDVRGLFNHDPNQVLGRRESGTLTLTVDETGLRYKISPPDTQVGRDVVQLLERGDVSGSSFAFIPTAQSWEETRDNQGRVRFVRKIESVQLLDVGPVTYPAYEATTAGVRAASDAKDAVRSRDEYISLQREIAVRARMVMLDTLENAT